MALPEWIRQAALFPENDLPDPPPEHPFKLLRRDGYTIGMFSGMAHGMVTVQAIAPGELEHTVAEARSVLAEHGKTRGGWMIPEAAAPAGVADSLLALGMVPFDEPPMEPRFSAVVLLVPPRPGPLDVEARLAQTFEEFHAAHGVAGEAFETSADDRAAYDEHERALWEIEQRPGDFRTFVAVIDGEVVGAAGMIFGANAAYLVGGSTHPDRRGRGVYRALVRARWEAAVAHGTPVLTVSAGRMSRPILERLGFTIVGWNDCLLDRFA